MKAQQEGFEAKYKVMVNEKNADSVKSTIPLEKRGRRLLLGCLDEKIQQFLQMLRKKGGVVNTVVANAAAKALISRSEYEHFVDLDRTSWAKSIFKRMGFVKRSCTTSKPEIPEGARKATEIVYITKL